MRSLYSRNSQDFLSSLARIESDVATRRNSDNVSFFRKVIRLNEIEVPKRKVTRDPIKKPCYPPAKLHLVQTFLIYRLLELMIIQEKGVKTYDILRCNRREVLGCGPGLVGRSLRYCWYMRDPSLIFIRVGIKWRIGP